MALNFHGDRAVGVLNDPKNTFNTDDLFRVYDGGILVAGGVSVDHGDFVSWDGTKWKLEADIQIARSDEVTQQSSNIAPNYVKQTYPANSYVMHGGVLYTNENAIETAEDWNPAHWTQTTVAAMIAGGVPWTRRTETVDVPGGESKQLDIQDHEFVDLHATHSGSNTDGTLTLNLHGECYVRLDKAYRTKVLPLVGDAQPTSIINTGIAELNLSTEDVLTGSGCGLPEQYDPYAFGSATVLSAYTSFGIRTPVPSDSSPEKMLLHSFGEGTIIITPLPA